MYWRLNCKSIEPGDDFQASGRFVLHRHFDGQGEHLDLRLETDGALTGWRIDSNAVDGEMWATEKAPHPTRWLDDDAGLVREDAGVYAWQSFGNDRRSLVLRGRVGDRVIHAVRETDIAPSAVRAVVETMRQHEFGPGDLGALLRDGIRARERAVARFCGLGRELDGDAFDEHAWRKALDNLSLDEIHQQLRAYEVRFDAKYPPQPASRPERLPEEAQEIDAQHEAWRILSE